MHQNYLWLTPGSDSPGNQVRTVGLPPHQQQQQQQQQQQPLNQLQGADLGWLARADEQSGSSWFVGTGGNMNRISPLFSPYPSWDWSCTGNVLDDYLDFLGGSAGKPPVSEAGIDRDGGDRRKISPILSGM